MIEVPSPSQSTAVIGHEAAKAEVESAFDSGRMHHAWLITGPEGIGKATFSYHVAHMLLSGGVLRFGRFNPEHPSARLVSAESHPDMYILRRPVDEKTGVLKAQISVEAARHVDPFLRRTTTYGGYRVVLIDEAHTLNRNGQNAILKMIEEPPSGAVVILTATTEGMLLPTIRSRCRVLRLAPLSGQAIETVLTRLGVDLPEGEVKAKLIQFAEGSAGRALQLIQTEALPLFDEALSILGEAPHIPMERLHKLADRIGKKAEAETFGILSSLILAALRESIRARAAGHPYPSDPFAYLTGDGRLDNALEVWEKAGSVFASAQTANLDPKLVFIAAMTDLAHGA